VISRPNHRRIAASLAVCYVLASTLSGLWHSHAGEPRAAGAIEHGSAHEHADHGAGASEGCDDHGCPSSDDDCVVCRFVAQSALPIFSAPELGRCELVVEVRQVLPAALLVAIVSCSLARAPPAAG
jgi:hypothetical protein